MIKQQRKKAVSLWSLPLLRSAVPVGWKKPPFHSSLVSIAPASLEKRQAVTTLPRPHLHTVASVVRWGFTVFATVPKKNRDRYKSTAPHFLAVALPPAINLNRNANADFIDLFRWSFTYSVAVTRSYPYSPEKGLLGPGWLSVTATPPPVHKKKLSTYWNK